MNRRYTLSLQFVPVMVINSKTSMLTTDILLEVEFNRAAGPNITTVIESARLSTEPLNSQNPKYSEAHVATSLSKFPMESDLLSIVNLLWKLPMKGSLVKHRLHLDYSVKNQDPPLKYTFDDIVELTVPDVEFEICTQVLSQQPGAQLCRATSPCHFVISIRFLKEQACSLLVVLDADDRMWTLVERTKMVTVKESGLGQLALTIIPVVAGYLPFPNVSIYECQLASDNIIPGNDILFFNRTAGKQIRVLSPNNSEINNFGKEDSSRGSNRIKKTIEKLFD
uniref:Trafficking protein particle complex subunit 13 n=1 Tax=Caenorhabditis tropicalis TaxID=1561998 RepID=A0A1I7UE66_9PELO